MGWRRYREATKQMEHEEAPSGFVCEKMHRNKNLHKQSKICTRCSIKFFRKTHNQKEWNSRKYCSLPCFCRGEAEKQKGIARPRGELSHMWKGDKAKYQAIHTWVRQQKGNAARYRCVDCKNKADEWSNVDGSNRRILSDYKARCRKCHRRYDKIAIRAWETKRKKKNPRSSADTERSS